MGRRKFWEPNPETMLEDLIRLAAEHRKPVDWHEVSRRAQATKKVNRRERSEAASARQAEAQREARPSYRPKIGERITDRLAVCMEPWKWYGLGDVVRAAGFQRHVRGKFQQVMLPSGLVERRKNSDVRPVRFGIPNEPIWLYRLTPKGEALRQAVMMVS